uniref:uncharacterized protein LOC114673180 n=1 Tax=Macaca mulatta TaxID=9544 RepID=UPI0010A297A3|nr:uncharacterized protein LOC114673180 [Macaca mulatta]XP_028692572.1 uncharacterized protein LOC114673180 [Macaca mulatta]
MTRQFHSAFWNIQTLLPDQSFQGVHLLPNDLESHYKRGHADGIVHSLIRKVTSFLLYSKERKLACFQLGYPDWKSARTVSFAPSFTILLVQVPQRRVGCVHMLICTYTMHRTRDLLCPSCVALGSKGKGESGEGEVIFHERLRLAGQQSLDGRTQFLALPLMVASFTKSLQEAASSRLSPEEETITVGEAPGNSGTSSRKKTGSKI